MCAAHELLRVLIVPGPTEIGLEVHRSLARRRDVEVHGAGLGGSTHGPYVYQRYWEVPGALEPAFADAVAELCSRHCIDLVYPTHDDALVALARDERLHVVGSPPDTVETCRSKTATYRRLAGAVPVPDLYERPADVPGFPVFVKPDRGQGSKGARRVDDADALARALEQDPSLITLRFLPGREYTVDCFTGIDRVLRFAGGRLRNRIGNGISMDTVCVEDDRFTPLAARINERLELVGGWFFQLREDEDGDPYVLEVAPRIAGTSGLQRVRGVNLPLLSVYAALGVDVEVRPLPLPVRLDRALTSRHLGAPDFDTLFIDLDDTLVVRDVVDDLAVRLVFQCINRGVRVELVTRHDGDLDETLRRHRLLGLFDVVHRLAPGTPKSVVVRGSRAVFVDDSFAERREVANATGVPGFDLSMIDLLIDERM